MRRLRRFFQTVQWKLVIIYISLILIAMQLIGIYFIRTVEQYFVDNFEISLSYQADSIAFNLEPYLDPGEHENEVEQENLNDVVENFFSLNSAGVQVIDQNGVIIAGSESEQRLIGQKNVQLEVNRALLGSRNTDIRFDNISGHRIMVMALPVQSSNDNQVLGAIYLWASMQDTYQTVRRINSIFATGTVFALFLTAGLGFLLSRTITNPVKAITQQTTAMANGDFNRRVKVMSNDEIGQLGQAFNHLTTRLREALSQNEEEREKLASVLANMSDGVIAADPQGRVVVYNQRAQHILKSEIVQGDDLLNVLPPLSPKPDWPIEQQCELFSEIVSSDEETATYVKITFTPFRRQGATHGGVIAVVQDVTEQARLDQQRKEFVANVSHELRTPLTTLKSYLEALDDGAMHDPDIGPRFLQVTRGETERMIRLIADLLQLSRMDSEETTLNREPLALGHLLHDVIHRFVVLSQRQKIRLELNCAASLPEVWVDRDQVTQVMDNLLSNALKYTAEGGRIKVSAVQKSDSFVEVSVRDNGIGIPKQDLSRIFERFYRVDKARSRNLGGTGLGLSIAREMIRAHGGQVEIDSEVKRGTVISFTLPVFRQEGHKHD